MHVKDPGKSWWKVSFVILNAVCTWEPVVLVVAASGGQLKSIVEDWMSSIGRLMKFFCSDSLETDCVCTSELLWKLCIKCIIDLFFGWLATSSITLFAWIWNAAAKMCLLRWISKIVAVRLSVRVCWRLIFGSRVVFFWLGRDNWPTDGRKSVTVS